MISHIFRQGPAIGATLSLLASKKGKTVPLVPGPVLTAMVRPRPRSLIDDYLRVVGADPQAWTGRLPPHMFPQWGWPIITQALHGLPYDLTRVVNAGCTWTAHHPLPDDQPLRLEARLAQLDDDGRRALFRVDLTTGTEAVPDALSSSLTVYCPLPKSSRRADVAPRAKKPKPVVPADARSIGQRKLSATQGWRFALVTGDLNPLHWLGPYARMAGFGGVILHGFCTAAIAAERVIAGPLAGDVDGLVGLEARFTRTLRLPAEPMIFLGSTADPLGGERVALAVGAAPGKAAVLVGSVLLSPAAGVVQDSR